MSLQGTLSFCTSQSVKNGGDREIPFSDLEWFLSSSNTSDSPSLSVQRWFLCGRLMKALSLSDEPAISWNSCLCSEHTCVFMRACVHVHVRVSLLGNWDGFYLMCTSAWNQHSSQPFQWESSKHLEVWNLGPELLDPSMVPFSFWFLFLGLASV